MSRKTLLSLAAATAFGLAALTSTSASAGNYGHGYSAHKITYSCHKRAVSVPYWRTIWVKKRISIPYGCGYKIVKVRRTVKRYKTIWKSSCH